MRLVFPLLVTSIRDAMAMAMASNQLVVFGNTPPRAEQLNNNSPEGHGKTEKNKES